MISIPIYQKLNKSQPEQKQICIQAYHRKTAENQWYKVFLATREKIQTTFKEQQLDLK